MVLPAMKSLEMSVAGIYRLANTSYARSPISYKNSIIIIINIIYYNINYIILIIKSLQESY